jgi:hypothetical protein
MAKKQNWKIPFTKDGSIPEYAEGSYARNVVKWEDPSWTVDVTLELIDWGRGRSAATFYLRNKDSGAAYPMKIAAFAEMVQRSVVTRGEVWGRWGVKKQGSNYSLYLVEIPPNPPMLPQPGEDGYVDLSKETI